MKLYTEKDLNKAMLEYLQGKARYEIIKSIKPIELPTDEEIEKCVGDGMHDFYKGGFIEGAKWYREQLTNKQS